MYIFNKDYRVTDGANKTGIAYCTITGKSYTLTVDQYSALIFTRTQPDCSPFEVAKTLQVSVQESESLLSHLIKLGILIYDDHNIKSKTSINSQADSPYNNMQVHGYYLFDLSQLYIYRYFAASKQWLELISLLAPFIASLCVAQLLYFYYPSNSVGRYLSSSTFYTPSVFQISLLFLATNIVTVCFQSLVGFSNGFSNSKVYFKLLLGIHPYFTLNLPTINSSVSTQQKKLLSVFLCSPILFRLIIISVSLLLLLFNYPFVTQFSQIISSILLTIVGISLMSTIWQILPTPGAISYSLLELYSIIPSNYFVESLKHIKLLLSAKSNKKSLQVSSGLKKTLFVVVVFTLIISKLLFFVLNIAPEISSKIPELFGSWTYQFVNLSLIYILANYVLTRSPISIIIGRLFGDSASNSAVFDRYVKTTPPLFSYSLASLLQSSKTKILIPITVILIWPFQASISGIATVVGTQSLDIKSVEREPAFISKTYFKGPSSTLIRKGLPILSMRSPTLEALIEKSQQTQQSLKAEISLLYVEKKSLNKGGSVYEASKATSQNLDIALVAITTARKDVASLYNQLIILRDQTARYKELAKTGALSNIQYQDKLLQYETLKASYDQAVDQLTTSILNYKKTQLSKTVEQDLSISENQKKNTDEITSLQAKLKSELANYKDLLNRNSLLTIIAPYDCNLESDTSNLMNKRISYGDNIISLKEYPSTSLIISIPEYDRTFINEQDRVDARLYTRTGLIPGTALVGKVSAISPISKILKEQEIVDISVQLNTNSLNENLIGSTGIGKIRYGYTCFLFNILRPFIRFVFVDLWQYFP